MRNHTIKIHCLYPVAYDSEYELLPGAVPDDLSYR